MAGITHSAVVAVPDDGASPVGSDEWNDPHVVSPGYITQAMLSDDIQVSHSLAITLAADYAARLKLSTDTTYRALLGLTLADSGCLEFGPGGTAARDTRLSRAAAGQLLIDSNGAAAASLVSIRATAGQLAKLEIDVAGDAAPRLSLEGDATSAAVRLGPGSGAQDLRAYRSGTKALVIDDTAGGPITVDVVGTLRQNGGGIARRVSPVAIANTETVVLSATLPAGFMIAGTTFIVRAFGRHTSGVTGGTAVFRVRIGTTTLSGVIPATISVVNANSVTNAPFYVEFMVTVRTAGSPGTAIGNVQVSSQTAAPVAFTNKDTISAISATVGPDTAVQNLIEFTYISGNSGTTATFENAVIETV